MGRILHLTLKKKWFDLITNGKKKIEYREIKPHWTSRLFEKDGMQTKKFDYIVFTNGYSHQCPKFAIGYKGLSIKEYNGKDHYALHLGKIIKCDRRMEVYCCGGKILSKDYKCQICNKKFFEEVA